MIGTDIKELQAKYPEYIEKVGKNYWWNFVMLVLDASIYSFSVATLSQDTIVPYFVDKLTNYNWIIGLVPAIYYFGYFLPQLIGAYIVNGKQERKWVIFKIALAERIGIFAIAVIAQYYGILSDNLTLGLFFVAFLLYSVTNGMISPGYADFISKNIIRNRGVFFGVLNGIGGLIGFGASLVARYLLETYSFPENVRALFWIGLFSSIFSPIFIALFREIPFPEKQRSEPLSDFVKAIPDLIKRTPNFRNFMISRAFLGLGVIGNSFYALYAIDFLSFEVGILAIFTMVILVSRSFIGFVWGWVGDRFGYRIIYIIASMMVATMGILAFLPLEEIGLYVIAFCIGSVYAAIAIADANMVFEIAPAAETSRFIGILNTFVAPVMILAPLVGGVLVDIFSHSFLFVTVIIVGVISTLLAIRLMPNLKQK
ncbi:MAG: MFS transporter [Chloroflexi bacterium]|nr:MFS transporter [Chloroflexota bacterium]